MSDVVTTDYLTIPDLLKAQPKEEGGRRFLYMEAANQALDYEGEKVLSEALAESADYFLRFGNLDLDHYTLRGPKAGIQDYMLYEIGRPVEVKVDGARTFVKGEIYQGSGDVARNANRFWDSLTVLKPPKRWYPSIGGSVIDRGEERDPVTGRPYQVIRKVRWSNIGFSQTPVNLTVASVSTVPFGALAKAWGSRGLDMRKALEAGYGTDSAALSGGAALREQSLDRKVQSYWDFRDRLAGDLRRKRVGQTAKEIVKHASDRYGVSSDQAAEWTERFLSDLRAGLTSKRVH